MLFTRRALIAAGSSLPLVACKAGALDSPSTEADDWPDWAPSRATLYARIAADVRGGVDLRHFGAVLDGKADDSAALERALASGSRTLLVPALPGARLRLTRAMRIAAPVTIAGVGGRPIVSVENPERSLFVAAPGQDDPRAFLHDVRIDGLAFVRPAPLRAHGAALAGYNLRGVSVTRCSATRMGLLGLHHMLQKLGRYRKPPAVADPRKIVDLAVLAGFSPDDPDDLNEDALVYDCEVDAQSYASQLARFDFVRRAAVVNCKGRFASVSWWGGSAKRQLGGDLAFLRRARDLYFCDNVLSGANGGIYGNNGQDILVARNHVSQVTDVGIDFEGCVDALARDNVVENAGNFCYATFYAARNIVFERNLAIQDGSARGIDKRFGAPRIGSETGQTLFALRSAGFGRGDGAVTVAFRQNRFVWRGADGTGVILPSYFDSLELTGNRFENVNCNLTYGRTRRLHVIGNTLRFTRAAAADLAALDGGAETTVIADNRIEQGGEAPAGRPAIRVALSAATRDVRITGNTVDAPGSGSTIEVLSAAGDSRTAALEVSGNAVARVNAPPGREMVLRDNRGPDGRAAMVARRPAPAPSRGGE